MAENSAIEWTEATWNALAGCTEISPGCQNCYAAIMANRLAAMGQRKYQGTTRKLPNGKVVWTGKINLDEDALQIPLKRKKPTVYFVNSMSDLFHEAVPDEFIDRVFGTMHASSWHTFQVLTKRPKRMRDYIVSRSTSWYVAHGKEHPVMRFGREQCRGFGVEIMNAAGVLLWPLSNVWLGVSVEDQHRADERIPLLLQTPAAVRFLSCEPLLGPVDLRPKAPDAYAILGKFYGTGTFDPSGMSAAADRVLNCFPKIDWVIVGGESGHGARPMHPQWARSIRNQCQAASVPFFFKQHGEWVDLKQSPECSAARDRGHNPGFCPIGLDGKPAVGSAADPDKGEVTVYKFGKKAAGRLLDGVEWNQFPKLRKAVPA